jgi:AcrR family transcriptional regulator
VTADSSRITQEATPGAAPACEGEGGLRLDARRNRRKILVAAREVFAERGIDAPMATVARRAGVGVATLYRRFPTRDALVEEAFADQMAACTGVFEQAVADPDPWRGLCRLVEEFCRLQREERGFPEAFLAAFPGHARRHTRMRAEAARELEGLVRRARDSGALRPDFRASDLVTVLVAHGGLVSAVPEDAATSRRFVAYLLDSFRVARSPRPPLPGPGALSLAALPLGSQGR